MVVGDQFNTFLVLSIFLSAQSIDPFELVLVMAHCFLPASLQLSLFYLSFHLFLFPSLSLSSLAQIVAQYVQQKHIWYPPLSISHSNLLTPCPADGGAAYVGHNIQYYSSCKREIWDNIPSLQPLHSSVSPKHVSLTLPLHLYSSVFLSYHLLEYEISCTLSFLHHQYWFTTPLNRVYMF